MMSSYIRDAIFMEGTRTSLQAISGQTENDYLFYYWLACGDSIFVFRT